MSRELWKQHAVLSDRCYPVRSVLQLGYSIGCIIPGVNVAAAQLCFALHYRHRCTLPKSVHSADFSELTACITEEMATYADRQGISSQQLTHEATIMCLDPRKSWWPMLAEGGESSTDTPPRLTVSTHH